jgi:DNA-binding HxlR family transcriptional regulator
MLPRTYDNQVCSVARTLERIGERWTMLIIRDAFLGVRRFDDFQRELGIARNVLTDRLARLVDEGILERRPYSHNPPRHEYFLTEKGLDLWPVLIAMLGWGDRHLPQPEGPPVVIVHRGDCGGPVNDRGICERCGELLHAREALAINRLQAAAAA